MGALLHHFDISLLLSNHHCSQNPFGLCTTPDLFLNGLLKSLTVRSNLLRCASRSSCNPILQARMFITTLTWWKRLPSQWSTLRSGTPTGRFCCSLSGSSLSSLFRGRHFQVVAAGFFILVDYGCHWLDFSWTTGLLFWLRLS